MKTTTVCKAALGLAALAAALCAGQAQAQDYGRRGGQSATLYELPNFQGRQITLTGPTGDLGDWRFNDRARSARFEGAWRICEHDDFGGRCAEVRGDVPDLNRYGLAEQVSSLEPAGRDRPFPRPGGGDGWGPPDRDGRRTEGARTVFFPRPTVRGMDVAAGDHGANTFCRRQGLGPAVWYDSSERARQAIGPEGQIVGRSTVIRDLLCRKY